VEPTVLVLEGRAEELRAILKAEAPSLKVEIAEEKGGSLPSCDIWLGEPDRAVRVLEAGGRPRWIQSTWAGYRPLLAEGLPRDYRLSRAVGVFGQPIAEYVLTYMLAHEQGVARRVFAQAQRSWQSENKPGSLYGRQVLIVGAGEIGREVAAFLAPFGVRLRGVVNTPRDIPGFEQVFSLDALAQAVAEADYIVSILPDTTATRGIFDRRVFEAMRPHALLINAGRGTAVVDEDLIAALGAGRPAGAVLDVFSQEPLPPEHPFWQTKGVTVTSHVAGPMVPRLMGRLFLENLPRFLAGRPLRGEVDFDSEY